MIEHKQRLDWIKECMIAEMGVVMTRMHANTTLRCDSTPGSAFVGLRFGQAIISKLILNVSSVYSTWPVSTKYSKIYLEMPDLGPILPSRTYRRTISVQKLQIKSLL